MLVLDLKNCRFTQGEFTLNADFTVEPGQKLAIIGPSGGGKSTLIAGLAGFLPPAVGDILWQGAPMPPHPGDRPMTVLFQDHNLFAHLTVLQNVTLGIAPGLRPNAAQKQAVLGALVQVGLATRATARPAELSGGEQGRVALARVLLRKRPVLLLDEPFAALGPALKDEMLNTLGDVVDSTQATVLMVTHDPDDARRFADQVILVTDGMAHAPVETRAIFASPPPALAAYLGARG